MNRFRHPITGVVFERQDDGLVRVEDPQGRTGVFDATGRWQSGELRFADAHACELVGHARTSPSG